MAKSRLSFRQAIQVKFAGPTNARGSRYIAKADAGTVTHHADHALNPSANAAEAAVKLAEKFGWSGELVGGVLPDGSYVFVFVD